jgi:Uma2 family endonuclease
MPQLLPWTIERLDRLPEDGNRYEVLDGELLVTPPPSEEHQEIIDWLAEKLIPFVTATGVGRVRFPRSVVIITGSQLEPDMMVRPIAPHRGWKNAPLPILVVEVLSKSTRTRDLSQKRDFYTSKGIPEYWAIDCEGRAVIRFTQGSSEVITDILRWSPTRGPALEIDVAAMLAETQRGPAR